ncbi:hypothetical protein V1514DRAFT_232112 [Lipomyces japonicus]|uniref:uncharacterized protein n=1 Tax=Lipomyces japonicus TaxID=56871 RepID=UPI0034CFFB5B
MARGKKRKAQESEHGSYYFNGRIKFLKTIFTSVCTLEKFLNSCLQPCPSLIYQNDNEDYVQILKTSVVGIFENDEFQKSADVLLRQVTLSTPGSHKIKDILDRVVVRLHHCSSKNIITCGFTNLTSEGTTGANSVIQEFFSSHYKVLCTAPWQILLDRIGENAMLFLLLNASIFVKIIDRTFLQIIGPDIASLSQTSKDTAKRMKQLSGVIQFDLSE